MANPWDNDPVVGGKTSSPAEFTQVYGPIADRAGKTLGVDPKVLLGQWGVETGWGKSIIPGTNNLGNIKDFSGTGVGATDNATGSKDNYRAFDSPEAFADHYSGLIQRKYPDAVNAGSDVKKFSSALVKGGYAEDPQYADKLFRANQIVGKQGPGARAIDAVTSAVMPTANADSAKGNPWDNDPIVQSPNAPKPTTGGFLQGAGNLAAGLVRGAGSIGATLVAPYDIAKDAIDGKGLSLDSNRQRRADMDSALGNMGAQTDSFGYGAGKLGGEIAGTAGAGGLVANAVGKFAPVAASAIRSGGLSLGSGAPTNMLANAALRTVGGIVNGAITAAMVNPEDAGMGAVIGGLLPGAVKTAGVTGSAIKSAAGSTLKNSLGMMSGVGGEAIGTAYNAGKNGATNFVDNMRGNVPMSDVLDSAKGALSQMRVDRAAQYRNGMAGVSADKTVIDFAPIDKAVASLQSMGNYKGQVINKNASGAVDEIAGLVNRWKGLDPAEFHTPEGLDALKQAISDVRDTTQFGTAARKAADTAYNAVKGEITTQAPTYAKVMKDYSQASETLGEIERALSLGNKAAADTSMRKLQSLMRNNVNTNYGNRLDMAKTLEQNGADILPGIAGQAMSSWTPRGLQGLSASGIAGAGVMTSNPLAMAALPMTSPRLVGEAAYGLGATARRAGSMGSATTNRLAQLAGGQGNPLTMNQLAPFLATAPVLAANQR